MSGRNPLRLLFAIQRSTCQECVAFPVTNVCELLCQTHTNVGEKLGETLIRRVMQKIADDRVTSPQTLLTQQMMRSMTFAVFALGMCLQAVGAEEGGGSDSAQKVPADTFLK